MRLFITFYSPHARSWLALITLFVVLLSSATPSLARQKVDSLTLRSGYLFNFILFSEWPEDSFVIPDQPLRVCIIGNAPLVAKFKKLVREKRNFMRPIEIVGLAPPLAPTKLQACHLLYIDHSQQHLLPEILAMTSGSAILTVSDMDKFCQRGGMIHLFTQGLKYIFTINRQNGLDNGLEFRSQLLRFAQPMPH